MAIISTSRDFMPYMPVPARAEQLLHDARYMCSRLRLAAVAHDRYICTGWPKFRCGNQPRQIYLHYPNRVSHIGHIYLQYPTTPYRSEIIAPAYGYPISQIYLHYPIVLCRKPSKHLTCTAQSPLHYSHQTAPYVRWTCNQVRQCNYLCRPIVTMSLLLSTHKHLHLVAEAAGAGVVADLTAGAISVAKRVIDSSTISRGNPPQST